MILCYVTSCCVTGTGYFIHLFWDVALIMGKKGVIVTTESLSASTLFLIFLSFFIIKVRFVFTTDFLSLDWTDLLSKIILYPITNVM